MSKENSAIAKEVSFGFLPVKKSERAFGFFDLLFIQVGIGISCFGFLIGGYTGMILGAKESIAAILFGNAFPVLLIMPIAIFFARYGVDTFIGFRSSLGYRGSNLLFGLFAVLNLGFITIACFMSGEAAAKLAGVLGAGEFLGSRSSGGPIFAVLGFLLAVYVAYKGPVAIKWLNWIGVPAFLLVMVGLLSLLLFGKGLDSVFALTPATPYETDARSFATALELNIGLGFSWLVYIGQYSRLAKTEKIAFTGGFWSYGVLVNVAAILGALCALTVGSLDASEWMMSIGGAVWGLLGLVLLIVGNITGAVFLVYSQAVSFKTVFPKKKWLIAIATTIPAIILMISPSFYDAYGTFISVVSYTMAVMGAIIITDFFFVKKQKITVKDLYNQYGAYQYWKGINPSAVISFVMGTIVYWFLYNPVADSASGLFAYLTAGLPTYFISAITYYICAKYIFSYQADLAQTPQAAARLDEKTG